MSTRTTGKAAARERAAQLRAAQQQADRRRRALLAGGAIAAVVIVILALVVAKAAGLGSGDSTDSTAKPSTPADSTAVKAVTSVPAATLDQIGAGSAQNAPRAIDAPALTSNGKPQVLYVGAEYCPFCAAERWPIIVALSRFGTWSDLSTTASASNDVFPDTPTFSFHSAGYTSDYLSFTGVETRSNQPQGDSYAPLDELAPADAKVFATYGTEQYTGQPTGSIPFLDIGGTYVSAGASLSPQLLAGKTQAEIAAALANPDDPIAKAVNGSANVVTAAICSATGNQPASVCGSPGVKAGARQLAAAQEQ